MRGPFFILSACANSSSIFYRNYYLLVVKWFLEITVESLQVKGSVMKIRNKREKLLVKGITYTIIRVMGEYKGFSRYVALYDGEKYVLKEFQNAEQVSDCIKKHEVLESTGIHVPTLIAYDDKKHICVEQYISGLQASDYIMQGTLDSCYLDQIKAIAMQCEKQGMVLDYYPTNFIVHKSMLVYVGCEYFELTDSNYYEKKGSIFWMNAPALIAGIATGKMKEINE